MTLPNCLLSLALTALLLLPITACERQDPIEASGDTIKIGVVGPFSGPDQAKGLEAIRGIGAAIQLHPLLANGAALSLVLIDDTNHPALSARAIAKLAGDKEVAAIMLASASGPALRAAPVADRLGVPVLALLATHTDIPKEHRFISQLCFDNRFQGRVAALFVRDELLLDSAAAISDHRDDYSTQLALMFVEKFRSIGGRVADPLTIPAAADAYASMLSGLRDEGVELLYLPVNAREVSRIVKAVDAIDWEPKIMGGDGLLATALTRFQGDIDTLEGIYATDFFSNHMPLTNYGEAVGRLSDALSGGTETTYAILGIEGYRVLYEAMNRCADPADRRCVNQEIRSTKQLEGVTGRLSIDAQGKAQRPLVVNRLRDGYMEFVVKVH